MKNIRVKMSQLEQKMYLKKNGCMNNFSFDCISLQLCKKVTLNSTTNKALKEFYWL